MNSFQKAYYSFYGAIFSVHPLHSKDMIAKVESFKSTLLIQKNYHRATSPMQTFTEKLPIKFNLLIFISLQF